MKIIIGSDHGGFPLKEELKKHLASRGFSIVDVGTDEAKSTDYPDFAQKAAEKVIKNNVFGILVCGTGIGMSITANKFKGVRAALCHDEYTARMAREHNDANILCMGGRTTSNEEAKKIADIFLATSFSKEERHKKRLGIIGNLEKNNFK